MVAVSARAHPGEHKPVATRRVVLFGGLTARNPLSRTLRTEDLRPSNDLWMYRVRSGAWQALFIPGDRPEPRSSHEAHMVTVDGRDHMLVYGGHNFLDKNNNGTFLMHFFADVWLLDFDNLSWRKARFADDSPWPPSRSGAASTQCDDGKIYVFGGTSAPSCLATRGDCVLSNFTGLSARNDLWELDVTQPEPWRWVEVVTATQAPQRSSHSLACLHGAVFLSGGINDPDDVVDTTFPLRAVVDQDFIWKINLTEPTPDWVQV